MSVNENKIINDVLVKMSDKEQHDVEGVVYQLYAMSPEVGGRIREKMIRKDLIEPYSKDGDMITDYGMDIIDEGGWIALLDREKSAEISHAELVNSNLVLQRRASRHNKIVGYGGLIVAIAAAT